MEIASGLREKPSITDIPTLDYGKKTLPGVYVRLAVLSATEMPHAYRRRWSLSNHCESSGSDSHMDSYRCPVRACVLAGKSSWERIVSYRCYFGSFLWCLIHSKALVNTLNRNITIPTIHTLPHHRPPLTTLQTPLRKSLSHQPTYPTNPLATTPNRTNSPNTP